MSESDIHKYEIGGVLRVDIHFNGRGKDLKSYLERFEVSGDVAPSLTITLCRNAQEVGKADKMTPFAGRYKGIPWELAMMQRDDGRSEVRFHSPLWLAFLVIRMILLPRLKVAMIELGGFSLIGSAFQYGAHRYVLFGVPGSGKTKTLLEATRLGADYIGDNELLIDASGKITSVFRDIELRCATVSWTPYWRRLGFGEKFRLLLYQGLSWLSVGKFTANLSVGPERLGFGTFMLQAASPVVVNLQGKVSKEPLTPEAMGDTILNYEESYRSLFGDIFDLKRRTEQLTSNLQAFLRAATLWRMPRGTAASEILELEELSQRKEQA